MNKRIRTAMLGVAVLLMASAGLPGPALGADGVPGRSQVRPGEQITVGQITAMRPQLQIIEVDGEEYRLPASLESIARKPTARTAPRFVPGMNVRLVFRGERSGQSLPIVVQIAPIPD